MPQPRSNTIRRRVVVTGAAGFLGGRVAVSLATRGFSVVATGRQAPPAMGNGIEVAVWDGRRPAPAGLATDAVVDCAAAIPARVEDSDVLVGTNLALARGAIGLARRTGAPLIFMSSQSAIGRPAGGRIDDMTPAAPDTPYGRSKLAAETLIAEAAAAGEIAGAVALRLPAVVGPGCHDNFPAAILARLQADEPVPVFNPDGPYNAVVHADTVAAFVSHLLAAFPPGFRAVSLASQPPIAVREAVAAVAAGAGLRLQIDVRPAGHPSAIIDPSGAEALGFVPDDTSTVLRRFGREAALRIATPPPPR